MNNIWSAKKAWEWYDNQDWIVGCNYVPSCCVNLIEIWQEDGFESVLKVIKRELGLASEIGINSVRMLLPFEVWEHQHDGFMKRLDSFLDVADKYKITLMPIFFDDCGRKPVELHSGEIRFGKQPDPMPGFHGGFSSAALKSSANPTYHMADSRNNWPKMEAFVKNVVGVYRNDRRILAWDIWNEPGNSGSNGFGNINKSLPALEAAFGWVREMEPIQPLTSGVWDFYHDYFETKQPGELTEIEQKAIELSDVVSFHYYGSYEKTLQLIKAFKAYNRPLFITEWLHRPFKNYVADHLPLYKSEKIACFNWGLVNGKTQTHEPWPWILDMDLDFSQWQHDLFKADGTPYREDEVELFKKLTGRQPKGQDSLMKV